MMRANVYDANSASASGDLGVMTALAPDSLGVICRDPWLRKAIARVVVNDPATPYAAEVEVLFTATAGILDDQSVSFGCADSGSAMNMIIVWELDAQRRWVSHVGRSACGPLVGFKD